MDRPPSPLFRQVAVEAASGTQIGASLTTHWRGVAAFSAAAFVLLAALIAFVALVEHSPVHRVAAFVEGQDDSLIIKLVVTPAAAASLRPGVAFRLAFRDYPEERFGLFEAKVDSINEVPPAARGGEPIFAATLSLPGAMHGPQGQVLPLKPGMRADVLVPSERRALLAWLLDALQRGRDDGAGRGRAAGEARR